MRRALCLVVVAGLVALAGCAGGFGTGTNDGEDIDADGPGGNGDLEIHHIDVGQADSTLVVTPDGETILIDTGDWRDDGQAVIDYLDAHDIDRIDHLVATHGHSDHIGGHPAVIEYVEENGDGVGAAYDSGVAHTSATYDDYLDAIEEHDVDLIRVESGDSLPVESESVEASILNPPEDGDGEDVDGNGIVLALEYGAFSYLTTGDADQSTEARLVDDHGDALAADAYQAGHHGSSTSSSDAFLERVDPEIAVISSALESQYGHPHDEILEAFADRGIETYWTGVHGDIVLATDGTDVAVETETDASTDPEDVLERKYEAQSALDAPATIERPRSGGGASIDAGTDTDRPPIDGAPARTAAR
ncbi:ComEC/Rec2 family competence protein [Natrinema salifodinae]|uniref:Competence protein ComEC n=1 Tax=Natrinema salifodinae TaxID=1202768 RepID=A0A1I0M646_9EURY|nr:MBL fold metallo-hydrolase [Natrinema salifodinae]SEV83414.1 competence protein ComEC [Natrinema salifodinae]